MTPEQHAELNAWIAENVFGGLPELPCHPDNPVIALAECPKFTTSPADASLVRKKCLEKMGHYTPIKVWRIGPPDFKETYFVIADLSGAHQIRGEAPTEELAWALFAKQLFGKADQ